MVVHREGERDEAPVPDRLGKEGDGGEQQGYGDRGAYVLHLSFSSWLGR